MNCIASLRDVAEAKKGLTSLKTFRPRLHYSIEEYN